MENRKSERHVVALEMRNGQSAATSDLNFDAARLDTEIKDRFGEPVVPCE